MGVTSAGKLYTWGDNSNGALGQGNTTDLSVPTQVGALTDWSHGAAGDGFSLLIKTDGTLWTFGKNSSGQLGHGNTTVNSSPIQVGALATWTAIRAIGGGAVIGLTSDGKLWGWGSGGNGRTGHGNTTNYSAPVQIGIATDWTAIGTTNGGGGAVNSSGKLYTWGAASAGRLGNGTSTPDISTPTQVGALTDWGTLSSNSTTMHSVKSDGTLWGWGGGGAGDLGDGTTVSKSSPVQIGVDTTWKSMDDSLGHNSPRIKTAPTKFQVSGVDVTDGTLFNWGFGESGQIGDGTAVGKSSPVQVGSRSDWASLSMSNSGRGGHGLKSDGTLWAWGDGVNGALGLGNTTDYSSPVQVGSLNTWRAIFGGHTPQTFIGVSSSGTLWTCGYNAVGEMGDSSTVAKSSPVQVGALTDWSHGSIDGRVALAIKTDGTMWSWGFNYKGALGVGDTANRSSPTQIGALTTWSKVTAGSYGGLAIKTDGTLWGWGYNRFGWLGTGNTTDYSSPVQIGAQTDWADIGMGRGYTPMGIKTTGKLYTWGRGTSGELGDGTTVSKSSPVQVGALTDWASAGANRSMQATKTDGTLWAWGDGNSGETGLGNTTNYSSPVQVGSSVQWKPFDHSLGHVNGGIIL
jgi:alpha-tubulin suppressor-like RCC1 family protein